jgi:hypothetical protein
LTRVKALARRFANAWANEYDTLRPVADLVARLQENTLCPRGWRSVPVALVSRICLNATRCTIRVPHHCLWTFIRQTSPPGKRRAPSGHRYYGLGCGLHTAWPLLVTHGAGATRDR